MENLYEECIALLKLRGVTLDDLKDCVAFLQKPYVKTLDMNKIEETLISVLNKREVQHAVITGINLDIAADKETLASESLTEVLKADYSLYGVDEVLAYGICNLYGSIALTNFGYIDKMKPSIIGVLNNSKQQCNTFLDDIVGAVAAAAASKLAHG